VDATYAGEDDDDDDDGHDDDDGSDDYYDDVLHRNYDLLHDHHLYQEVVINFA
jgi:hypothetical protein